MQNVGFHVVFAVSVHIAGHIGGAKVAGELSVQNVGIAHNVVLLRQSLHDQDLLDHTLFGAFAVFQVFIHTAVTGLAQHGLQRNAVHLGVQVRLVQHGIGEILLHIFGQGIGVDLNSIVQLAVQLIGFLVEQQAVVDIVLQFGHIVHAHRVRQVAADPIIGQVGGHILVDVVQRGGEHCVLASQVGGLIVIWEGDIHIKGFAGHVANDLILEAVNKGAAAQGQIIIAAGAAVKGNAVNGTGKVNVHSVTVFGGAVGDLVGGLIVGKNVVGNVIVNITVAHGGGIVRKGKALSIRQRDVIQRGDAFQVAVLVIGITERKISQIRIIIGGAFCGSVVRNSAFTGSFAGSCALGGCFAGGCAGTAGSQAKNHAACQQAGSSAGQVGVFHGLSPVFFEKIHRVPQQGKIPPSKADTFLLYSFFAKSTALHSQKGSGCVIIPVAEHPMLCHGRQTCCPDILI